MVIGVIPNPLPVVSIERVLHKLAVDREIGFWPSSTDVDRGTTLILTPLER